MKTFLLAVWILWLTGADVRAGGYTASSDSYAMVWNKYPSKERRIEWSGGRDADGYASGHGVALFFNASQLTAAYLGLMQGGHMEGDVVAIYPKTAMCYVGGLREWSEDGHGVMIFADGSRYEGGWSDGDRVGNGTQWSSDGAVMYRGSFAADLPTRGSGVRRPSVTYQMGGGLRKKYASSTLQWFGGTDYQGAASGVGVVVSRDARGKVAGVYHCAASSGVVRGDVIAIYVKVQQAYVGAVENWSEEGEGQMLYPDGTTYTGGWSNAERNGIGMVYAGNGDLTLKGRYVDGALVERLPMPSGLNVATSLQPAESNANWALDDGGSRRTAYGDAQVEVACKNILLILCAQKGIDLLADSDRDELGALFSLFTKYTFRSPGLDQNLRIVFPNMSEPGRRLVRNVLCATFDGTWTMENLAEREVKSELIAAARREGASEGEAMTGAVFMYDLIKKLVKINSAK